MTHLYHLQLLVIIALCLLSIQCVDRVLFETLDSENRRLNWENHRLRMEKEELKNQIESDRAAQTIKDLENEIKLAKSMHPIDNSTTMFLRLKIENLQLKFDKEVMQRENDLMEHKITVLENHLQWNESLRSSMHDLMSELKRKNTQTLIKVFHQAQWNATFDTSMDLAEVEDIHSVAEQRRDA